MTIFSLMAAATAEGGKIGEAGHHAEATLLGLGPEGWVYVGVTIFFVIAIFYAKAHHRLLGALDAQINLVRSSLAEAATIRSEAEALLVDAKRQQVESGTDAAAIIGQADREAAALVAKASDDAAMLIARSEKMAQDKIAAAERAAIDTLRGRAAQAAAGAAGALIAQTHDARADAALVDEAIAAF